MPVSVIDYELYIADSIARLANPLLTAELRLIHVSCAPQNFRGSWLLAAVSNLMRCMALNSPLVHIVATVATPTPLTEPGSGLAAL